MKRILSLVLVIVMLVGCVFTFSSCGKKPSGVYSRQFEGYNITETYEFKGKKYKVSYSGELGSLSEYLVPREGKFKVSKNKDKTMQIAFAVKVNGELQDYADPFSFEKGDDYIVINGIRYNKQKK